MINAMKFVFENFKFALEPACVAGIAALLGPLKNQFKNQKCQNSEFDNGVGKFPM